MTTGKIISGKIKSVLSETEQDYASVPSVSKERINAITANKEQAKYLGVEVGSTLLLWKRLVCDPGDRPIEYNIGYYRADSFTYEIDIIR